MVSDQLRSPCYERDEWRSLCLTRDQADALLALMRHLEQEYCGVCETGYGLHDPLCPLLAFGFALGAGAGDGEEKA